MATREVGLRVEDFMGINADVSSEDLQDVFYKQSQNLYERILGELQRRGGSALLTPTVVPSRISAFRNQSIVYDRVLGDVYTMAVNTTPPANNSTITNANLTCSFVNDAGNGKWGNAVAAIANSYIGCVGIQLVYTGFGLLTRVNSLVTAGVPVSGDTKRLDVTLSSAINDSNVTQIEVYAKVITAYNGGNPCYDYLWVGRIDVTLNPTGTWSFYQGPITLGADPGATSTGTTNPVWTVTESVIGPPSQLTNGKTYYVAVLPQRLVYSATLANCRNNYSTGLDVVTGTPYQAITIQNSGYISVGITTAASQAWVVCMGVHPKLLKPVWVGTGVAATGVTIGSSTDNTTGPKFSHWQTAISCARYSPTGTATSAFIFKTSDFNQYDMLAKIANGLWTPIGICNYNDWNKDVNHAIALQAVSSWAGTGPVQGFSLGADFNFARITNSNQELVFGASTTQINLAPNLLFTDGQACSVLIMAYNCVSLPPLKYLAAFKDSLVGGGGPTDSFNILCFSNAGDPFNWNVPGSTTLYQYVKVSTGGAAITGIGLYTNTSGQAGPIAQLIVGAPSQLWVLTDLPVYTAGSNNNTSMIELSGKVGIANHRTICPTDIGTIITAFDNVYLVRETGEPVPIGAEVSKLLKSTDPTVVVDSSQWSAVYHDNHYKLSYSVGGSATPSQEVWLDVRKMKQLKGQPCWQGPHAGREITYQMVEDRLNSNLIPKRICVDATNKRWYQADKEDVTTDFGTNITCVFESKDFMMGEPNTNKKYTRTYWRVKADTDVTATELTTILNESGESSESQSVTFAKTADHTGGTYNTFLAARAKIYNVFPLSRLRGETVRKKLTYAGTAFFSISGFTGFYEVERRRIG